MHVPQAQDESIQMKCSQQAIEFKSAMVDAIITSGLPRKLIAYDLGYKPSDLSHWLSMNCPSTLPGDLVVPFCKIVGNKILLEHLLQQVQP